MFILHIHNNLLLLFLFTTIFLESSTSKGTDMVLLLSHLGLTLFNPILSLINIKKFSQDYIIFGKL